MTVNSDFGQPKVRLLSSLLTSFSSTRAVALLALRRSRISCSQVRLLNWPHLFSLASLCLEVTYLVSVGIGRFTIADEAAVRHEDLGVNFFLDQASLGRSRAECCTEFLIELNPEVQGDWFPKSQAWSSAPRYHHSH
jgi:hypothetical protein